MDYKLLDKSKGGLISPSKLRMRLIGPRHRNYENESSNSFFSRKLPTRSFDSSELALHTRLLSSNYMDDELEVRSDSIPSKNSSEAMLEARKCHEPCCLPKFQRYKGKSLGNRVPSIESSFSSANIYPMKYLEDDDTSSTLQERRSLPNRSTESYKTPFPYKWSSDAGRWIINWPNEEQPIMKSAETEECADATIEALSFFPSESRCSSDEACGRTMLVDPPSLLTEAEQVTSRENLWTRSSTQDHMTVLPSMRSDSLRDVGPEMSHGRSQDHSRTPTFRREEPVPTSEEELKRQTIKEIADLSVRLGKTRIASWVLEDELHNDYEKRAAAWKEAEHCKHLARYRQEELRIQAWEREQRGKHEAEMHRVEAEAEQMKAQARAKAAEKLNLVRQRSEEKHAVMEARKARDAEKTEARAQVIRKTGRIPQPHPSCFTALTNLTK